VTNRWHGSFQGFGVAGERLYLMGLQNSESTDSIVSVSLEADCGVKCATILLFIFGLIGVVEGKQRNDNPLLNSCLDV